MVELLLCEGPTKSGSLDCRDALVAVVLVVVDDASVFCFFLAVVEVFGCVRGFLILVSLPSVAVVELPLLTAALGSFFLRTLLGAAVLAMLFLASVWPVVVVVAEASFSTPPPTFTWIVELPECRSEFGCVAVASAAVDGDSGDFGGDESSGEEL